jgi:hypothetical protein
MRPGFTRDIESWGPWFNARKMRFVPILRTEFNYGPNPIQGPRSIPCPRSQRITQGNLPAYRGIANEKSLCYTAAFMKTKLILLTHNDETEVLNNY